MLINDYILIGDFGSDDHILIGWGSIGHKSGGACDVVEVGLEAVIMMQVKVNVVVVTLTTTTIMIVEVKIIGGWK